MCMCWRGRTGTLSFDITQGAWGHLRRGTMTYARQPEAILPEFRAVFERHTQQLNLSPEARQLVLATLARGSRQFPPPDGRDAAVNRELTDAIRRLDAAMGAVAERLQATGGSPISAEAVAGAMQLRCPLPPFCYADAGS